MKHQALFKILENTPLPDQDFLLKLQPVGASLEGIRPGQFVQVLVPHTEGVFLRRPISVCDADLRENIMTLYVKKVGKGTVGLSCCKPGENLDIVFPLGNGFDFTGSRKPLLLGGGAGIAPMVLLSKKMRESGIMPTVLLAGRTESALSLRTLVHTESACCTDDGSFGEKGLITQHSLFRDLKAFDKIFCCGPTPMMKAVARLAEAAGIPCEVSLENTMACGVGACLCCVTPTVEHGNQCVCTEGPVFDSRELKDFR